MTITDELELRIKAISHFGAKMELREYIIKTYGFLHNWKIVDPLQEVEPGVWKTKIQVSVEQLAKETL